MTRVLQEDPRPFSISYCGIMEISTSLSLDSSTSSSISSSRDRESPKNRSSSFSISAILSDDVGSHKRSGLPVNETGCKLLAQTPKRPKETELLRAGSVKRPPQITLTEAASLLPQVSNTTLQVHPHPVASLGSTPPLHPRQHNTSLSFSPFDPSFLHALGQQASPTEKEDLLSDSLGMLSTVALYHSEISSSLGTPTGIQSRMADIRITSSLERSDKSSDWNGGDSVVDTSKQIKSRTPSILKRRTRKSKSSVGSSSSTSGDEVTTQERNYLNTGFLSPLADEKSTVNNRQSGFSPSIFLSRPDHSLVSDTHTELVKMSQSTFSDTDSSHDDDFATSTPIKLDKENAGRREKRQAGWSPNILRRRHLANESSSSSDSEHPVKRPRSSPLSPPTKRHKSKARTKLSPLLENACSPIPKADHTPSPLTRTHSTTPTRPPQSQPPHSNLSIEVSKTAPQASQFLQVPQSTLYPTVPVSSTISNSFMNTSLLNMSQPQQSRVISQLFQPPTQNLSFPINPMMPTAHPPMAPLQQPYPAPMISSTHQYPQPILSPPFALPTHTTANPFLKMPFYIPNTSGYVQMQVMPGLTYGGMTNSPNFIAPSNTFVSNMSMNSFNANQSLNISLGRKEDKLKSVPPRFIFSNMRPEKKRSRLTEAINKSLSETPSENSKLPKEWTKYACGQTNDQKDMTEKAKSFILQCNPRTLNFEETS